MGDYASKGVAGTGLGLGIAGTALGLLNNNGCGGGILGNLFGGGCCHNNAATAAMAGGQLELVSRLMSEIAQLKAENYSDKNAKEVYQQTLTDNLRLRDELYAFIKPLADESANNRVNFARLEAEQKCCCEKQELREQIITGKINEVALTTKGRFEQLDATLACLAGKVQSNTNLLNDITSCVIPRNKICPEVMPRFNSWVAPTAQAPDTQSNNVALQ